MTRKQTWTSLPVPSHRHVLLANSSGIYAAGADGTYSGGLSATGGSAVLRVVGGEVIDSLSWGDASSSFVEGTRGRRAACSVQSRAQAGRRGGQRDGFQRQLSGRGPERLASPPIPFCRTHAHGPANTRNNGHAIRHAGADSDPDRHADGYADGHAHRDGNSGTNATVQLGQSRADSGLDSDRA